MCNRKRRDCYMTRRTVLDKLQYVFGKEVMSISDVALRRKHMLEVLLNKEHVSENIRQCARKTLDKLTSEKMLDGKGSHSIVTAIIYFCMIKNGENYIALTPFSKKYGFTPHSIRVHYRFIANYS